MIARVWRGVIRAEHVEEYVKYVEATGGGEYKRTPGNGSAWTSIVSACPRPGIFTISVTPPLWL
jgi:hypothetical protein